MKERLESREAVLGTCPVHEFRGECWDGCLPERVEFTQHAANLRKHWFDRRHGMRPRKTVEAVA